LPLADVIPDVGIEGGDGRWRADQTDHILAALGTDLELFDRAGGRREAALVDDLLAAGQGGRQHEGASEGERDGATHGRILRSRKKRKLNMSRHRPGVNRGRRSPGSAVVSPS